MKCRIQLLYVLWATLIMRDTDGRNNENVEMFFLLDAWDVIHFVF